MKTNNSVNKKYCENLLEFIAAATDPNARMMEFSAISACEKYQNTEKLNRALEILESKEYVKLSRALTSSGLRKICYVELDKAGKIYFLTKAEKRREWWIGYIAGLISGVLAAVTGGVITVLIG